MWLVIWTALMLQAGQWIGSWNGEEKKEPVRVAADEVREQERSLPYLQVGVYPGYGDSEVLFYRVPVKREGKAWVGSLGDKEQVSDPLQGQVFLLDMREEDLP